jgi:FKBP-type peptidyl-prolyl cis-trans isomerase 2
MSLQKNDFIEINFTGRTTEGNIFDSNIESDIKGAGLEQLNTKPFIYTLGHGMFLPGIDSFLIGKDSGKSYEIKLSPELAFGLRDPSLISILPLKSFTDHKINPYPGAVFNFDGRMGRILSNSGGRVRVDFNHPLAGKEVIYSVNVLRKIEDKTEQVKAFNQFLFRKDLDFKIENDKIVYEVEKQLENFIKLFEAKFKEIFNLGVDVKIKDVKKNLDNVEKSVEDSTEDRSD